MKTTMRLVMSVLLAAGWVRAADLSKVPQMSETKEQRDEHMQRLRDAKFGMFIHWGAVFHRESGDRLGRKANRSWHINGFQTPRTDNPV